MTDYVIDASIVVQRLIRDTYTQHVKVLFRQLLTGNRLIIPEFCLLECTNVIWKQVRFQGMPQDQADNLVHDLNALPLTIMPVTGLLARGLYIGLIHELAVYDSVYIALAERLRIPLITADERQEKAANAMGVTIKALTDF
ncbi:MAG: type II toxin-antitoxin system VapC family toxin [Anaerolineaceae bacterium]|nr:type II toxin-antitoxin system VapC family toxin [Anaerolineaceae bacterium]